MTVMHGSEDDCGSKTDADQWYKDQDDDDDDEDDDDDDDDNDFIIELIILKGQNFKTGLTELLKFSRKPGRMARNA